MGLRMPVYLEEVARCHVANGAVHFCWDGFEIAIPVSTCVANMAACREALDAWERRKSPVIKFPAKHG